jgi:hypothetical protein
LLFLFRRGGAGDDVAADAPQGVGISSVQSLNYLGDHFDDGSERVAIEETERRNSMTSAAKLDCFLEGHLTLVVCLPQGTRIFVAIARRAVEGRTSGA